MPNITIVAEPVEPITVELVGKPYTIKPPKSALSMRMAVESKLYNDDASKMADVLNVWISKAFGTKNAKEIHKRLDDADDLLDIQHIMSLMEQVMEYQMPETPTT